MDVPFNINEVGFEQVEMANSQAEPAALEGIVPAIEINEVGSQHAEMASSQTEPLRADEQLQVLRSMGCLDLIEHIAAHTDRVLIQLRQTEKTIEALKRRLDMLDECPRKKWCIRVSAD